SAAATPASWWSASRPGSTTAGSTTGSTGSRARSSRAGREPPPPPGGRPAERLTLTGGPRPRGACMTPPAMAASPEPGDLRLVDAWWRAANYLSVGQIYLLDNPLLRVPLRPEHVKPRLLGHFGTTPGLNLVYAHLNRVIRLRDVGAIYVC